MGPRNERWFSLFFLERHWIHYVGYCCPVFHLVAACKSHTVKPGDYAWPSFSGVPHRSPRLFLFLSLGSCPVLRNSCWSSALASSPLWLCSLCTFLRWGGGGEGQWHWNLLNNAVWDEDGKKEFKERSRLPNRLLLRLVLAHTDWSPLGGSRGGGRADFGVWDAGLKLHKC